MLQLRKHFHECVKRKQHKRLQCFCKINGTRIHCTWLARKLIQKFRKEESHALYVLGRPKSFFRFIRKQRMHKFRFTLFCRITCDPFCSIKMKITTFDRLGFMFVYKQVVVKDVSVKERHFLHNIILEISVHSRIHIK